MNIAWFYILISFKLHDNSFQHNTTNALKNESPEKKTLVTGLFKSQKYFVVYQYIKKTFRDKRVTVRSVYKICPSAKVFYKKNTKSFVLLREFRYTVFNECGAVSL